MSKKPNYCLENNLLSDVILQSFLDNDHSLAWIYNADGVYQYANKQFCDFVGQAQLKGKTVFEVFDNASASRFYASLQLCIQKQQALEYIERIEVDPVDTRNFLVHKFPIIHTSGTLVGGIALDVTQHMKAEEEIKFQAYILDNMKQAIIGSDADGTITYWNKHATELYGWKKEEALGKKITMIVVPEEKFFQQSEQIMDAVRSGQSWSGEFYVRNKAGDRFPVFVTDTPLFRNGQLKTIIGVSYDISEQVQADNRLKAAVHKLSYQNEVLREIAFLQSHEVRKPLANILGLLPLLDAAAMSGEQLSILQLINDAAGELDGIIRKIVDRSNSAKLVS